MKRYCIHGGDVFEDEDGEWVKYEDLKSNGLFCPSFGGICAGANCVVSELKKDGSVFCKRYGRYVK